MKILFLTLIFLVTPLVAFAPMLPIADINAELSNYTLVQAEQEGNGTLVLVFATQGNPHIPIYLKRLRIKHVKAQDISIVP